MNHRIFRAEVVRVAQVTPHMVRVTLGGADLHDYEAQGKGDEYCKVLFPHPGERHAELESPEGREPAPRRNYTIRRLDRAAGELDLDFVAHEGGVAAQWALRAEPGMQVGLTAAGGKFVPPPTDHWLVLVGDATALPAIGRIVEESEAGRRVTVIGVVTGPEEEQEFATAAELEVRWEHVPVAEAGPTLRRIVTELQLPDGPGYLWMAGESEAQRAIRRHLRHDRALPADSYATMGYWRVDRERWDARYAEVKADIEPRIEEADRSITDDEEFFDVLDEIYEGAGL